MPKQLRFTGWKAQGLRCPDHTIDLIEGESPAPVALIQMPNGTGKTTSLEMLRAALSGEATEWGQETVRSYQKQSADVDRGSFEVSLQAGSNKVTIKLTLNFLDGTAEYETTHNKGNKKGFHPPVGLRRFLDPDFVEFFIFDGELADRLLNPEKTDARQAIESLFQLQLFDTIQDRVWGYWVSRSEDKRIKNESVIENHKDKRNKARNRLDEVRQKKEEDEKKIHRLKKELKSKENQFEEEITKQENLQKRLRNASEELERAKGRVESAVDELLEKFRSPYAILPSYAEEIITLKESLDRVQLPERTAREFFEELAEEEHCICGRELGGEERENIRRRADQYLGSDDVAFLNAMKQDISEIRDSTHEAQEDLGQMMDELVTAVEKEQSCQNRVDTIRSEGAAGSPQIRNVKERIDELKGEINDLEDKMERYESLSEDKSIDETWGIEVLERRVKHHEQKVGEVANTLRLHRKKEALRNIIENSSSLARDAISEEVCNQANERISRLMPNNDIRISGVDHCLELYKKERGSAGETLTIGYAFLSTLFDRSDYQLPFIVDSPANPIDLDIREKIGEIIPKLSDQFIAFTISSERPGFVEALHDEVGSDVKFLTLFRKGLDDAEEKLDDEPDSRKLESKDGWRVEGSSFFRNFQVDEDTR
jgi:DNA sulfur modification protein DndD